MQDRPLNGSFLQSISYLSVGPKTGHNSLPQDSLSSTNMLLRFIIYVENKEKLHCIKKTGTPAFSRKKEPAITFHARNTPHKKKKCFNLPTLTLPRGPEALDIFHGLPWEQMVTDNRKNKSCTRKGGEQVRTQGRMGKHGKTLCKSHLLLVFV